MERNLLDDISATTNLSNKILYRLIKSAEFCICDSINEADSTGDEILNYDVGIGVLSFLLVGGAVRYRFTPSRSFEESITKTLEEKTSPLVPTLEFNLEQKIKMTYKELL